MATTKAQIKATPPLPINLKAAIVSVVSWVFFIWFFFCALLHTRDYDLNYTHFTKTNCSISTVLIESTTWNHKIQLQVQFRESNVTQERWMTFANFKSRDEAIATVHVLNQVTSIPCHYQWGKSIAFSHQPDLDAVRVKMFGLFVLGIICLGVAIFHTFATFLKS